MPEELSKRLVKPRSRFLIYTSAGNHAQVHRWLRGRKDFDLWITCYATGNKTLYDLADYYHERKGGKFPNFHYVFHRWLDVIRNYDAIWIADDDLHISATGISELFRIRAHYDLTVLQPAFSQRGKVSHSVTRARCFSYLRYTNFIEVTCPLFRADKLAEFMRDYDPRLVCHGVDYWYMQALVGDQPDKAAVVDAIVAINPHDRSKGGREILTLQSDAERSADWKFIQSTRKIREIASLHTWSTVRRYGAFRVYASTLATLAAKGISRWRNYREGRVPQRANSVAESR